MARNNHTVDRIQAVWNMIGGDAVVDQLIAGTAKLTVELTRRLTTLTPVKVAGGDQNPHNFFMDREGLWVSSNFRSFILSGVSKATISADGTSISYADVVQPSSDAEIGRELPEGYVFENVDAFLAHLATLIRSQWGGKEGVLLTTDYANIFYARVNSTVFAVHVRWYACRRGWSCRAFRLGGSRWRAGGRAFSATAT